MPHSMKPIACINGSRTITDINLDRYLDYNEFGTIVTGGARGVDTEAEHWAKRHKLEWICYLPQWKIYGKRAGLVRNKDMVDFSDILISFWDGSSAGTKQTIEYAKSLGKEVRIYLFENLD